jgi:hypothetical protein
MFIKIYRVRYRTDPFKICSALVFGTNEKLNPFLGGRGSCGKEGEGAEDGASGALHLLTGTVRCQNFHTIFGKTFFSRKNFMIVSFV